MNIHSGRRIVYLAHIRQSITVILSTRLGTRLMREHFGSLIPAIIDQPANSYTYGLLVAAIYNALLIWEPRIVLQSVEPVNHIPPKTAGTFSAQVAAPDGINLKTQALMRRMIEIGKPASRHLAGLVVSLQSKGTGFNAAHCIKGQTLSVYPYMPGNKQTSGSAYQAVQNYQIIILHSEEQPL